MNISQYPAFRPIELGDKPIFDEAFRADPPRISEFTFTNLYAWRNIYELAVARADGFLILRTSGAKTQGFYEPIGRGDKKGVISMILDSSQGIFIRLPEETVLLFKPDSRFKAEPSPDDSDYVFSTGDLISLSGSRYNGKRNLINKFRSTYSYEYMTLDASSAKKCLDFEEAWCSVKDCDNIEGLDNERVAVKEMLTNFSLFNLMGGAIKVDGQICAVAVAERLNPDTLVIHILKSDPNMSGSNQIILNEFLAHSGGPFKYVNMEQDLGVEGVRRSKLSYHPVTMVKKYTLRQQVVIH